jgi:hypothetical protein
MSVKDHLKFRYSGFLQNVEIEIKPEESKEGYKVSCFADLKLPILKKKYTTSTLFHDPNLDWKTHQPVSEKEKQVPVVLRGAFVPEAIDPIGFFLKIHRNEWFGDKVNLVIGAKSVILEVKNIPGGLEISRPEKDQKLIVRRGEEGIEQLEVPIPVIGSLTIKRV